MRMGVLDGWVGVCFGLLCIRFRAMRAVFNQIKSIHLACNTCTFKPSKAI